MNKRTLLFTLFSTLLFTQLALADLPTSDPRPTFTPTPPGLTAKGYILIDANSNTVIAEKNADARMEPASLTKMMSMYVISNAIRSGQIHMNDTVLISKNAWQTGGSRMFVKVGTKVPVKELLQGIIVASGNDAVIAMTEYVAGTEKDFVTLMNQAALQLGMHGTHYMNATGLPHPNHYSTPHDTVRLAQALIRDFPDDYKWYKQKWYTYNSIKQPNRNRLLWRDDSVDGVKTGHTDSAGYCLVASAQRNGMRLLSAVMGTPSDNARTNDSAALINFGFRFYNTSNVYKANQPIITPRTWLGENNVTPLGVQKNVYVTALRTDFQHLQARERLNTTPLRAPIEKNKTYGTLDILLDGKTLATAPLVALQENKKGGFFTRLSDEFSLLLHRFSGKTN